MNILHLKYAVEVAKTQSISKAAENLYMGQPNLSRAIKELEESLGITIFHRTSKGIITTPDGDEFLQRAKKIVEQIEEVEEIYRDGKMRKLTFSVCVPRAGYFTQAMAKFARTLSQADPTEISYTETNTVSAVSAVSRGDCSIGFARYCTRFEKSFEDLLAEKKLISETVAAFTPVIVTKKDGLLAKLEKIYTENLSECFEITFGDSYSPALSDDSKKSNVVHSDKRICVYDSATAYSLLEKLPNSFMYGSPFPKSIAQHYGLIDKTAVHRDLLCKDVLIYRREYKLSELDKKFITEVCNAKRECFP